MAAVLVTLSVPGVSMIASVKPFECSSVSACSSAAALLKPVVAPVAWDPIMPIPGFDILSDLVGAPAAFGERRGDYAEPFAIVAKAIAVQWFVVLMHLTSPSIYFRLTPL
jgi:hypothetical protein